MLSDKLRQATRLAQQENDLPDYLAERIYRLADRLDQHQQGGSKIDLLLEQLSLYDTYGQTGYLGMGVNHLILEKTILAVEKQFCSRR